MQIVPISAGFGATVCDVGLTELGDDGFRHIEDAFRHWGAPAFPAGGERELA